MKPKVALFTIDFQTSAECIRLLDSFPRGQVDLIAILKNSPDEDTSALEAKIKTRPGAQFLTVPQNLGIAGGWNHLIQTFPDFDAFIICGSDVVFDQNTIPDMISAWQNSDNQTAVFFPPLFDLGPNDAKTDHLQYSAHQNIVNQTAPIPCLKGSFHCFLTPKSVFQKIGLFDSNLFLFSEDTEFYHRLSQNQIPMLLLPQTKIWHPVHNSFSSRSSDFLTFHRIKSRLILNKKHPNFRSFHFHFWLLSKLLASLFTFHFSTFKIILQAISEARSHQLVPIPQISHQN